MTERRYGSFRRQLSLPADADPESIEAKVKHGVLTVTIEKDAKASPSVRKIEIGN
jgi:HSP20 family protein